MMVTGPLNLLERLAGGNAVSLPLLPAAVLRPPARRTVLEPIPVRREAEAERRPAGPMPAAPEAAEPQRRSTDRIGCP